MLEIRSKLDLMKSQRPCMINLCSQTPAQDHIVGQDTAEDQSNINQQKKEMDVICKLGKNNWKERLRGKKTFNYCLHTVEKK